MVKKKLVLANNPLLSGPAFGDREKAGIPYREIEIGLIDPDPQQPRTHFNEEKLSELAASIRAYGVLSPIIVRPSDRQGRYSLVSGERRLRAAQMANLLKIPAIVDQRKEVTGETTLAIQLVENLQRTDLSPLERAHAIGVLSETYDLSVREIAAKLGLSKSMVQRSLEILTLPDDLMNALKEGAAESKVLVLAKIEDPDVRAAYLKDLDVLTRTQIQEDVDKKKKTVSGDKKGGLSAEDQRIADEIQRALGLKVRLTRNSPGSEAGKLTVDFYSSSDLQEIFRKLVAEE